MTMGRGHTPARPAVDPYPPAGQQRRLLDLARGIYDAFQRGDFDGVIARMHPEVEQRTWVMGSEISRGHDAARRVLEAVVQRADYRMHVERFAQLDDETVLGVGSISYTPADGGVAVRTCAWLWTFDDGLMRTHDVFPSEWAARRAFEEHRSASGRFAGPPRG